MNHRFLYIILVFFSISICAQNTRRIYKSHSEENGLFTVVTSDGKYMFQFYAPEIIETSFIPNGDNYNSKSHAVVMTSETVETTYKYTGNTITFGSAGISVMITTEPFQISYSYNGKPLISERLGYYKSKHQPMDLVKDNIIADETEKIEFNLTKDEALYGGGARALGMNRRGNRLPLFNRAHYGYETRSELMNYTMPIVLSSNKYMIHFDNAPIGYLDLDSKKDNTLTYETISGRKTYQVIAGNSWYDIVEHYTDLTGKQPMLPRWAFGNFSSRFGYHSQKETIETINTFKEEKIPVDAIILDLYWFGKDIKGAMGNLGFYKDSFPNPKAMIKDLRSKNIETILITEPFVLTTSERWNEADFAQVLAKDSVGNSATYDFYFGNTGLIDIYSKKGNSWFKNIYKGLSSIGVTGFWGDLGEPEVHPGWVQHAKGSADEVHNIYGHDWAKLVYEASLEANPDKRPFILMRAGSSGSQHYGIVPWSGDVSRSWGGLQSQPEIALQMGMQGIGYMHSDLGGFSGSNLDDELYTRWLQYGVFQPIFRPHAQEDVPSEPVYRSEEAKRLASFAIQMRYRMLPYNYNFMFENYKKGTPLMRPLFFEEPDNPDLLDYTETYLWGNDILVAPILESEKTEQAVYFPATSHWFNIETDKIMAGGQTKLIKTHPAYIPTFVRAGAFIPLAKPMQTTADYDDSNFQLQYYHHNEVRQSRRDFYFDDGITEGAYASGNYQILTFDSEIKGQSLNIEFKAETGNNFEANFKAIELTIHNISKEPKRINICKKRVKGKYNETYKTLTIPINWNTQEDKEVRIELHK